VEHAVVSPIKSLPLQSALGPWAGGHVRKPTIAAPTAAGQDLSASVTQSGNPQVKSNGLTAVAMLYMRLWNSLSPKVSKYCAHGNSMKFCTHNVVWALASSCFQATSSVQKYAYDIYLRLCLLTDGRFASSISLHARSSFSCTAHELPPQMASWHPRNSLTSPRS
jgi:hypothetical protein